jgi:hypothetical protein
MIGCQVAETMLISAKRIRQDKRVAAVVLRACEGVTVTEAIQLFRIDAEHGPPDIRGTLRPPDPSLFFHPRNKINDPLPTGSIFRCPQHLPL